MSYSLLLQTGIFDTKIIFSIKYLKNNFFDSYNLHIYLNSIEKSLFLKHRQ
jgi:hypothetical protein